MTFFGVALATFWNISKMCEIEKFQRNLSTIFLKLLNIYLFSKIFQKVKIVMLQWNILQCLKKMLREYFSSNERLEIFLTYFCNILCYVGIHPSPPYPTFPTSYIFAQFKQHFQAGSLHFARSTIETNPKYKQTSNWKLLCWNNCMLKLHCVEISNVKIALCWNFEC